MSKTQNLLDAGARAMSQQPMTSKRTISADDTWERKVRTCVRMMLWVMLLGIIIDYALYKLIETLVS